VVTLRWDKTAAFGILVTSHLIFMTLATLLAEHHSSHLVGVLLYPVTSRRETKAEFR
jgi:hypothetical protein